MRSARRWLRQVTVERRGMMALSSGCKVGIASAKMMKAHHCMAAPAGRVQPATSAARLAGADSERRRLSSIFHKPINGMRAWPRPCVAAPTSRRPKIHGNNCQSPRTQRCWRSEATS